MDRITPDEVVAFWREAGMENWFQGGDAFDRACDARFRDAHFTAGRGELEDWLDTAEGGLAVLILLDQIPRNIFRDSGHAFATDGLARHYAQRMIDAGHDRGFEADLRGFVYLPFEHSEALADQRRSVELFAGVDNEVYRKYAQAHLDVIERFGRFPHRNRALGRINTPDEQAWLDAGGGF
ncbi:conserved hypothetical protein [Luteimonas sp. 9C]|uniref:DUF924 family protein n=1 Tax=Luteimonas sp. 9C TaxID=2653148 RepID=UPI0012EF4479|nr:DUF924 family protein [Luteimonas sp. 9C]VXB37072.1 conserved hypothetical protein [Luteimonas sp. 9C]